MCDHPNESYWAVLWCGTVHYAVQGGSNFQVCGWNPSYIYSVRPFKWKLLFTPSCLKVCLFPSGHLDALLRGLIIGRLGKYGHPATLAEARQRFDAHCKGESTIPADLRSAVYGTVLRHGDGGTLESMMKLFREADLHEEKVRLMRCMGAVSQPELINKVLEFSMSVCLLHKRRQSIPKK